MLSNNLINSLHDSEKALSQLNLSLKYQSRADFLLVLRDVAIAQGFATLAQKTGLSREGLYKILDPNGNPKLETLISILKVMGFELQIARINKNFQREKSTLIDRPYSLAESYPTLAEYWNPTKNENLTPRDVTNSSRKKIWWQCSQDSAHEWKQPVSSLIKNVKTNLLHSTNFTEKTWSDQVKKICPYCARNKTQKSTIHE